jgi:hypothetical protein
MNKVIIVLDQKYSNLHIMIADITTLTFYGPTKDYSDGKEDSSISFRVPTVEIARQLREDLKNALTYNVDKSKYVGGRDSWEEYYPDKRPTVWLRLPSGLRGLSKSS